MKKVTCTLLTLALPAMLPVQAQEDGLPFELGGHVRVNYGHIDWAEDELRDGLEFESFRLNVSGEYESFSYKAEYRWYENTDFNTVRYADLTYTFDEYWKATAGITKVPFGLLPFASNSFLMPGRKPRRAYICLKAVWARVYTATNLGRLLPMRNGRIKRPGRKPQRFRCHLNTSDTVLRCVKR